MEAEVLHQTDGIQLSYDLPHRNYDTCVYPRQPIDGSTIIIYGHDEGLRIAWYSGLPSTRRDPTSTGASSGHDAGSIKHDEYDVADSFKNGKQHLDPTARYLKIGSYKDISLGSAALRLAHVPLSSGDVQSAESVIPPLLNTHIVLAVACADLSIKVVICPLQADFAEEGKDIRILSISEGDSHTDLISAVALTVAQESLAHSPDSEIAAKSDSNSHGQGESLENKSEVETDCTLLLASISPTGGGLLAVHQIIVKEFGGRLEFKDFSTVQRQSLKGSLLQSSMSFNPAILSAERCFKLLITYPLDGCAKIFDMRVQSNLDRHEGGSVNTLESGGSSSPQTLSTASKATCCITLYAGFASEQSVFTLPRRKKLLDAAWICQGRAILVLLEDGEWGVWNVENAGLVSSTGSQKLLKAQSHTASLQGGSLSRFAIRGRVRSTAPGGETSVSHDAKAARETSLAPMTPHSRKTKSEVLFKGSDGNAKTNPSTTVRSRGNITKASIRQDGNQNDDAILLRYGATNMFIPSMQSLWRADIGVESSSPSLSASSPGKQFMELPHIRLAGENAQAAHLLAINQLHAGRTLGSRNTWPSLLVSTPSRLLIHSQPMPENNLEAKSRPSRQTHDPLTRSADLDQALLKHGELDVDGMDRLLDKMEQDNVGASAAAPAFKKSVGFVQQDEDGDVEMVTPMQPRSSNKLFIKRKGTPARQNLFA